MKSVRFKENDRGGAWRKGEKAWIVRQLSSKPLAQDDIYLVARITGQRHPLEVILDETKLYWCVGSDIEPWNQLALF